MLVVRSKIWWKRRPSCRVIQFKAEIVSLGSIKFWPHYSKTWFSRWQLKVWWGKIETSEAKRAIKECSKQNSTFPSECLRSFLTHQYTCNQRYNSIFIWLSKDWELSFLIDLSSIIFHRLSLQLNFAQPGSTEIATCLSQSLPELLSQADGNQDILPRQLSYGSRTKVF